MRLFYIFQFLFLALVSFLSAESRNPVYFNYYAGISDELNFGRLSPVSFKYTVSHCTTNLTCGHNLFDSNKNSEWNADSGEDFEFVQIDFGTKRLFNSLHWDLNSSNVTEIYLQVQFKGEWKTIAALGSPASNGIWDFTPTDASILRIVFKKNPGVLRMKGLSLMLNDSIITGIPRRLSGYSMPISGAMIPADDYSLPGAPRKYRNGVHKGLDFNTYLTSDLREAKLDFYTPIYSIGDGEIVRIDLDYIPMNQAEFTEISQYNQTHPVTYVEKDFGGRQIWIDHKNGVMSSYNHLSSILGNLRLGSRVAKGEQIGYAGNSGLSSEAKGTKEQIHLHLEIWIDGEYLGNDLKPMQIRKLLQYFFSE